MPLLKLTKEGKDPITIDATEVIRTSIGLKVRLTDSNIAYYHPSQYEEIQVIIK